MYYRNFDNVRLYILSSLRDIIIYIFDRLNYFQYSFPAKALLDKGADPNQKDILGNTPLHLGKNWVYR